MPTPAITINFKLQTLAGAADPAGSLVVTLCNYGAAIPRVAGTSILADVQITPIVAADGTGSFLLWGNDVITPGPNVTFYMIQVKNSQGGVVQANIYQFTGSGTLDLSSVTPLNVVPTPPIPAPPNAVVTNPVGIQTIVGFALQTALIGSGTFIGSLGSNLVSSAATPQFDLSKGSLQKHTLNQNITPSFVNLTEAQPVWMVWTQDGAGNRGITFPANVKDAEQPDPTAGLTSFQKFMTIGTNLCADGGLTPII